MKHVGHTGLAANRASLALRATVAALGLFLGPRYAGAFATLRPTSSGLRMLSSATVLERRASACLLALRAGLPAMCTRLLRVWVFFDQAALCVPRQRRRAGCCPISKHEFSKCWQAPGTPVTPEMRRKTAGQPRPQKSLVPTPVTKAKLGLQRCKYRYWPSRAARAGSKARTRGNAGAVLSAGALHAEALAVPAPHAA